jgi:hypothetical protein
MMRVVMMVVRGPQKNLSFTSDSNPELYRSYAHECV